MKHSFTLIPFTANTTPEIEITGAIARRNNRLEITYRLRGTSQIIIPEAIDRPTRQYDLWEHTCFEFFLRLENSNKYWEFNLSPAGHWNVFRFPDYRQDIAEEMAFASLPFQVSQQANLLQLDLEVNLNKIIAGDRNLEVAITTVVEDKEQQLSYWALTHPGTEADFHHRDSFAFDLKSDGEKTKNSIDSL